MNNAFAAFRRTFTKVRRDLARHSGFGMAFAVTVKDMQKTFRAAMIAAAVPATPARVQLVNSWVARASRLGGAA